MARLARPIGVTPLRTIMLAAAAAGLAVACVAFDWHFLNGTAPLWTWPSGDRGAYLTPILYFVRDPWRLPLFALPQMGYPEGGSVIFNDAIPIGALVSKVFYEITGRILNHVGWWVLVSYPLQAALGVRLVWAMGERSRWKALCLGVWPLLSLPFLMRFGHTALTSQFLLLWALAVYFEQVSAKRPFAIEQAVLLIVALLINPYLFVMTVALIGASWIALWKDGVLQRRDLLNGAAAATAVVLAALVSGHFAAPTQQLAIANDGRWSWNAATMIVPRPVGIWWHATEGVTRYLPHGQYEGESYLGIGPLVLLVACLLTRPRAVTHAIARHWPLVLVLAGCAVFAASTRVYFASHLLFEYSLPSALDPIIGMLRAQGRFIWPVVYVLLLAPAILLLRGRSAAFATVLIVIATAAQVVEAVPVLGWSRTWTQQPTHPLFDADAMTRWFGAHDRLWQYPSFWCGGAKPVHESVEQAMTRQIQMQVLAARAGIPNNSVYMSRALKDCAREAEWASHPALDPGTLYVFLKDVPDFSPAVAALIQAGSCQDLGWGTVCSRRPLP